MTKPFQIMAKPFTGRDIIQHAERHSAIVKTAEDRMRQLHEMGGVNIEMIDNVLFRLSNPEAKRSGRYSYWINGEKITKHL